MSVRALTSTFVVASLLWACAAVVASRTPVPVPAPAPPEAAAEPKPMSVQLLPTVSRPDGRKPLEATRFGRDELPIPGLDALSGEAAGAALAVLNHVTGACDPCQEAGLSLAACFLQRPPSCAVVDTLAARVVRLAGQGQDANAIARASRYDDSWFPIEPGDGPARGPADAPLRLLVALDYVSPFTQASEQALAALSARYGDALRIEYLYTPRQEPAAMNAAKVALAAQRAGCFPPVHAALLSNPEAADQAAAACGTDLAPLQSEAAQRLQADLARGRALGVRGTPTVFINGHRVRGMRDVSEYLRICELELLDREG